MATAIDRVYTELGRVIQQNNVAVFNAMLPQLVARGYSYEGYLQSMGESVFETVLKSRGSEIFFALLNGGAQITTNDIYIAAKHDDLVSSTTFLNKATGNIDVMDANGWTALQLATYNRLPPDDIRKLLMVGANPHILAPNGFTPFQMEIHQGSMGSVLSIRLMINSPLRLQAVDSPDRNGWPLLQVAILHGCLDLVDVLLKGGANPNKEGPTHETALVLAIKKGFPQNFIQCMINRHGADPAVAVQEGGTPLDLAKNKGYNLQFDPGKVPQVFDPYPISVRGNNLPHGSEVVSDYWNQHISSTAGQSKGLLPRFF